MPLPPRRSSLSRRRVLPPLEGLEARQMLSVTVFRDGFESPSLAGWTARTYQGASASPKWGVNSVKRYSGTQSAFVAGPGRNTYADGQHTSIVRQNVSLAGYGSASLTFKYYINTEAGYDFFSVNVIGADGKATNVFRDSGSGDDEGWRAKTLSLNNFAGKSGLGIELRFDSDDSLVKAGPSGVWVDDVRLVADTRPATATIRGTVFDDADGDRVRDSGEAPLPGWTVYLDRNQNRRRDSGESYQTTDGAGRYTFTGVAPGTHYVVQEARPGYTQTSPVRASATQSSQFHITVGYGDSSFTGAQRSILSAAVKRWTRVVVGDIPSVTDGGLTIDDLYVDAAARDIDGRGGVLAQAAPGAYRDGEGPGGGLPYRGQIEVDAADLRALEQSGQLLDVLTHELAHVLGFGTMWEEQGLLRDVGSSNPRFTGPVATAQYNAAFGRSDASVPVENQGGPGTHDTHWRESVFGNEMMTGFVDAGANPISRVTAGALADLGYVVDLAAADAYAAPGRPPAAPPPGVAHVVTVGAGQTRSGIDFGNRRSNQPPAVASLSASPEPAAPGATIKLTAGGVADPGGSVAKVGFYRESNGVAGLQVGGGGDTLVATDSSSTGGYAANVSTAGLAAGTYTYYALATDNAGATSATGTSAAKTSHSLQSAGSISGTVYRDANNNAARNAGETGVAGVRLFLDANGNGRLDSGERTAVTDSEGAYRFSPLVSGAHTVRIVTPLGHKRAAPSSGEHAVRVGSGKAVGGKDFGLLPLGKITGRVFNDLDRDGQKDGNEAGVGGFRVYVDANDNGRLDSNERSVLTEANGTYSLKDLGAGSYVVRSVLQTGWRSTQASPVYRVTVGIGQTRSGHNFGIARTA